MSVLGNSKHKEEPRLLDPGSATSTLCLVLGLQLRAPNLRMITDTVSYATVIFAMGAPVIFAMGARVIIAMEAIVTFAMEAIVVFAMGAPVMFFSAAHSERLGCHDHHQRHHKCSYRNNRKDTPHAKRHLILLLLSSFGNPFDGLLSVSTRKTLTLTHRRHIVKTTYFSVRGYLFVASIHRITAKSSLLGNSKVKGAR